MLRPGLQPVKAFTLHQQDRWRVFCTTTAEMSDSFHIGSIAKRQRQKQMIGVRSLFGIVILAFREMSVSCSFKYIVSNISAAAAAALFAVGFSFSTADAASDRGPQTTAFEGQLPTWGSAPIQPTLIEIAQREKPIRGVNPALASAAGRPFQAVVYRTSAGR